LIGVAIAFVLVLGLGYASLMTYLRSDSFRKFLSAEVSQATKVKGEFSPFKWDGLAVKTDSFVATGEGLITTVKAEGLHTEVGMDSILRGVWEIRDSSLQRLDLSIDASKSAQKDPDNSPRAEAKAASKKPSWLPSKARMEQLEIHNVSLTAKLAAGTGSANGMNLKLRPKATKNAYDAEINGGSIRLPFQFLPQLEMDRLRLSFQDRQLFLTEATLGIWEQGLIEATGEWDLKLRRYAFEGNVSGITCEEAFNPDWSKRLQGKVSSTFSIEDSTGHATARGKLTVENATLTALPVLDTLAAYADTRRFRILNLNEAHTTWLWRKDEILLSDLVISSEGLVRLEGNLIIRGEALDGNFRLGLVPGTLSSIPGAETDVFTAGERGLLWTNLRITGTLEDPKEDLSDRLMTAAGLRMFDQIPETGEKVIKFTRSLIPEHQSKTVDKGIKILEESSDVIREASGILGGLLGGRSPAPAPAPPPSDERK